MDARATSPWLISKSALRWSVLLTATVAAILISTEATPLQALLLSVASGAVYFSAASNFSRVPGGVFDPWRFFLMKTALISFLLPLVGAIANAGDLGTVALPMQRIDYAILVVVVFYLAAWVGVRCGLGQTLAQRLPAVVFDARPRAGIELRLYALYSAALAARILALSLGLHQINPDLGGATTSVSSILVPVSQLGVLAFSAIVWRLMDGKRLTGFQLLVLLGLIVVESLYGLAMGSKSLAVLPLLYVAICWSYQRRPIRPQILLLSLVALLFFMVPLLDAYRQDFTNTVVAEGKTSIAAVDRGVAQASAVIVEDYRVFLKRSTSRFSAEAEGLVMVVDQVPSRYDYQGGSTFFPSMFYNLVPRVIWPEKPIKIPGREFSSLFWGVADGQMYGSNQDISWVGEAYFNFGLLGSLIAFLLGIMIAFYQARLRFFMRVEALIAPRLIFVLFSVLALSAFHYYLGGLVRSSFLLWLALCIIYWRVPRIGFLSAAQRQMSKDN